MFTLYTSTDSQWVGVPHLAILEKGYVESEYDSKERSLWKADNFDPEYLRINPAGTIPSLTSASLQTPLTDSREILKFLDTTKKSQGERSLFPQDTDRRDLVEKLIEHIHSDSMSTNIILLMARDKDELEANKSYGWGTFLLNRQVALEKYHAENPSSDFYAAKVVENGASHQLYTTKDDQKLESFFVESQKAYTGLIDMLEKLDAMIALPYAAGDEFSAADIHLAPWFAHALFGVRSEEIGDLHRLETHLQKSVPSFRIGDKTRSWWSNINSRDSFKEFYPKPH